MTERRGLLGGVFLALGGVPLLVVYGTHPIGYLGGVFVLLGVVIGYGATKVGM